MADPEATPPAEGYSGRGTRLGMVVGCSTFVVGLAVSWAAAKDTIKGASPQREVFEAMYWDGIWSQWCCGGGILTTTVAFLAGALAYRLSNAISR